MRRKGQKYTSYKELLRPKLFSGGFRPNVGNCVPRTLLMCPVFPAFMQISYLPRPGAKCLPQNTNS